MNVFESSKWIWCKNGGGDDEYAEIFDKFVFSGNQAKIRIAVDGDYTLYINGKYLDANQFCDFEHYKNYDEIDITDRVFVGENTVSILVWHFGKSNMRYRSAPAGAIYEIISDGAVICASNESTLSRLSPCYKNGRCKLVTPQLGFGFAYDATKDDGAIFNGCGFDQSVTVDKSCTFFKRVGEKMKLGKEKQLSYIKNYDGKHYLIDLGAETVGLLSLRLKSKTKQLITVAWGEHIIDGGVRRIIGSRDFSVEYTAKPGNNEYTNYMLRLGLRYIELFCEDEIELEYAGVLPQYYPTVRKSFSLEDKRDAEIYELCVRTLELSMMEHYVDCPWREQCLYVFDSRNQMLCGYYVFENGNAEYVRANMKLIINDTRPDGLLSITYPSGLKLAIPSFSLHFYTSLREYYEHTGDDGMLKEAYPKIMSVMRTFVANRENGLLCRFDGDTRWNFYDWSDHLSGNLGQADSCGPDLVCNCLFIRALDNLKFICEVIGEKFEFENERKEAFEGTRKTFFDKETGLFSHTPGKTDYTALGNALAILNGLCTDEEAALICRAIVDGSATECSLSLKPFV